MEKFMGTTLRLTTSYLFVAILLTGCGQTKSNSGQAAPDTMMSSSSNMQNYPVPSGGSGKTTLNLKVLASAELNGTLSLSSGPISSSADAQIEIQFTADGKFRARCNHAPAFDFQANRELHLTIDTDAAAGKYSVTAQFEGQRSIKLADNCSLSGSRNFSADLVINNLGLHSSSGLLLVGQIDVKVDFSLWADISAYLEALKTRIHNVCRSIDAKIDLSASINGKSVIEVDLTQTFEVNIDALQASADCRLHIEVDGHNVSGPLLASQISGSANVNIKSLLVLPKGKHVVQVVVDSGSVQTRSLNFKSLGSISAP